MTSLSTPTNVALQIGVVVLTLITAFIHLSLNFPDPMFILNGLGYLMLLAALYLPLSQLNPYRGIVCWLLIGHTVLTFALWLAIGVRNTIGYVTAVDEVAPILLLRLKAREPRSS